MLFLLEVEAISDLHFTPDLQSTNVLLPNETYLSLPH